MRMRNINFFNLLVWNWAGTDWKIWPITTDRIVISERAPIDPSRTWSIINVFVRIYKFQFLILSHSCSDRVNRYSDHRPVPNNNVTLTSVDHYENYECWWPQHPKMSMGKNFKFCNLKINKIFLWISNLFMNKPDNAGRYTDDRNGRKLSR